VSVFILDTDTLTLIERTNPAVLAAVAAARAAGHTVATTAVTIEEQANGWFAAFRAARTHAQLAVASRMFSEAVPIWGSFRVYPQTEASLARFDALVALKLNVGKMDLRIASVALELGAAVVTHNQRDFGRVPGLSTADWTVPPASPPAAATPAP
jgi:tRNA(fMet)-specific endonuclease VapC